MPENTIFEFDFPFDYAGINAELGFNACKYDHIKPVHSN